MATTTTVEKDPRWSAVDAYVTSKLHLKDNAFASGALPHALHTSSQNNIPDIAVSPTQGKELYLLAKMVHAKRILEIGTLGGYSTIWLARSLLKDPDTTSTMHPHPDSESDPGGQQRRAYDGDAATTTTTTTTTTTAEVVSLEINPHHAQVAQDNVDYAGLTSYVRIMQGHATDLLRGLVAECSGQGGAEKKGPFQLIFIDADKEGNRGYFCEVLKVSEPGTIIIVDNVVRRGQVANTEDAKTDPRVAASREVIEWVGKHPDVEATVVQTVSDKSYDGYLLARVK